MNSFVYKWTDNLTGMMYIGVHKGSIDDGYVCSSKYMMEQYMNRPSDFSREILTFGEYKDCREIEMKILREVDAVHNDLYYNRSYAQGAISMEKTPEHREKIRQASLGKKQSDETKAKRRLYTHSQEARMKIGNTHRGIPKSDEQKKKMSLAAQGKPKSIESVQKMKETKKGSKLTEEHRLKIGLAMKQHYLKKKPE